MFPVWALTVPLLWAAAQPDSCRSAAEAYSSGNLEEAARRLEVCVEQVPGELSWLIRLCALYQSLGNDEGLLRASLKGVERFPEEIRFYQTAGIRSAKRGDLDRAVSLFGRALGKWPTEPDLRENYLQSLLVRGMARLDQRDNEGAVEDLRLLLSIDRSNVEALINLGRALYNLRRPGEALDAFDRASRLRTGDETVQLHRGIALLSQGRHQDAVDALDQQILRRDNPEARYFRGLALKAQGENGKAFSDLQMAAEGMPDNPDAFYELGRCLGSLDRLGEAEAALRRAVSLDPAKPKYLLALGQLLVRMGRVEEGRTIIQEARSGYARLVREDQQLHRFGSTRSGAGEQ